MTSKIYSIKEVNNMIRQAGFLTARIVMPNDKNYVTKDAKFVAVLESGINKSQNPKDTFESYVLSKVFGKTVLEAVWYNEDCVKITFVDDDDKHILDDDV